MDYNYYLRTLQIISIAESFGYLNSPRSEREYWVHPFNKSREDNEQFKIFYLDIRQYSHKFFEYYRMSIQSFDELLENIRPYITKKTTTFRNPVSAEERLTITRRYLSTGTNFAALQYEFLLGRSTIGTIIRETCQVLWTILQPIEMPDPTNPDKWLDISNTFYKKINFPNCIGAVDGKHIRCINPNNAGSMFYNYKKYFLIVLIAVVDAEYCFTTIDVGAYGREGDSTVFKECNFGKKLYSEELNLPAPTCLPNTTDSPQPFVIVADEAFGLYKNLLRPYLGQGLTEKRRIFNYRLSRARRIVECAFGILANKWRVSHTPLLVEPDFIDIVVKSCCILHNYVRRRDGYNFEDTLSYHLEGIQNYRNAGARYQRIDVRDYFADYFVNAGSVAFQPRIV